MTILHLYVSSNLDGIIIWPEKTWVHNGKTFRQPDAQRRVILSGDPNISSLTSLQLNAAVELAFRAGPEIRGDKGKAVFYDADFWAQTETFKIVCIHTWDTH